MQCQPLHTLALYWTWASRGWLGRALRLGLAKLSIQLCEMARALGSMTACLFWSTHTVFTLGGQDDASSRHRGNIFASFPGCTRLRRSRCYQLLRWIGPGVAPPNLIPNAWLSFYLTSHHLSARRTRALPFVFVVAASRPFPQLSCLTYQIQALATCLPAQLWQLAADHAMDPPAICEHGTKEARLCVESDGVASNSVQDAPAQRIVPTSILASMAEKGVLMVIGLR